MTSYFEHVARQSGREDVALDVIDFTPDTGIEVTEERFESIEAVKARFREILEALA